MTKEDVLKMIGAGESQWVELKSNFNVEAMEAVAAFANAEGGKVVIGVSNKGIIVGVDTNFSDGNCQFEPAFFASVVGLLSSIRENV